ncbi:ComEC/Rec2 family competence protein [Dyadobacter sp. NIV53]|uniref:ComEC/Rec2 family competence protein n=1 Tax=Dyadobacter sp. NIV53 TaxID=2861765 RepID=UPI001C8845FE|nr:ComEC/Rec2 family competence protein [Dyadobacter sp. NIV53]
MSGILLKECLIFDSALISKVLLGLLIAVAAIAFYCYQKKSHFYFGTAFSLFLVIGGALSSSLQNCRLEADQLALTEKDYSAYEAIVKSLPEKRSKSIRLEILVTRMLHEKLWIKADVKALVSIAVDAAMVPKPGDYMIVNGRLDKPVKSLNPEEFDYRRYLWNKGIVWTDYLPEDSYSVLTSENQSYRPGLWSTAVSEWADRKFRDNIKNDDSYGLVKAMLLGRRDDLGSDQIDDYTVSGTIHILSVSGMHVAILFMVISKLFGWLKRWKTGKYAYLLVVTALLCFYALVTGLVPSVQRATLMCIVFIISEAFSRKQTSMNTLAISGILILILDPHALYDVGFQLSFLAMSGIFLLYESIDSIWKPSNFLLKYVWQITALSFAAQLATFPLSLFYFHQFPFYFWLINPFVIFFTNFLLPASMALLFASLLHIDWLQFVVNFWVEASAYLTNISVSVPKLLPGYLIENLYLDRVEVMILYLVLTAVWYSYYKQEYLVLKRSCVIVVLFVVYSLSASIQTYLSAAAIIHSVPRHSVMSFKIGNKLFISSDEAFQRDVDSYKFHIKNYAISQGITETVYLQKDQNLKSGRLNVANMPAGKLISWRGKIIYHGNFINSALPIDYELITGGKFRKSETVSLPDKRTMFLLGGEIRGRKKEKWTAYLSGQNYKIYDLSEGSLLLH